MKNLADGTAETNLIELSILSTPSQYFRDETLGEFSQTSYPHPPLPWTQVQIQTSLEPLLNELIIRWNKAKA